MAQKPKRSPERFPWLVLLLLVGTIYLFWLLPRQQGPRRVDVKFDAGR